MASNPIRSVIVLCVDDDIILSLLQAALEAQGMGFLAANNGRDALEVAAEYRPDGVILDHYLPDMTGGELAAEIKRICPDTKIIMFSALPELPPDAVGFLDAFVYKSEGVRPLLLTLQRILGRPQPEARRFPRYPVRLPLAIIVNRLGSSAVLFGICSNFGEGGIGCTIEGNLVPGEFVQVQGSDSRLDFSLESHAHVRYRKGETYGFAFCDVTPQQQVEVQRLCQRLASACELLDECFIPTFLACTDLGLTPRAVALCRNYGVVVW
jgi:CheY-like chemotaxis protein